MELDQTRETGALYIVVAALVILIGGLTGAFHALTVAFHRSSSENRENEEAFQFARTGANYFLAELASDSTYFDGLTAPTPGVTISSGSFAMESLSQDGTEWNMVVVGQAANSTYRLGVAMGYSQTLIPGGIVIGGTGSPADLVMQIQGSSTIGSYHPDTGFDLATLNDRVKVSVHGSVEVDGGSALLGELEASGTISGGGTTSTLGETAGATVDPIASIDPLLQQILDDSQVSNDNGNLAAVFGAQWAPVASADNYGDLIVTSGSYVVPAGTYRFRRFEVSGGAQVTFDNSSAPTNIVYIGMGDGTGAGNDLQVSQNSSVVLQSSSDQNLLRTILDPNCDFRITQGSIYGQNLLDAESAGYSQVLSLGGDASADEFEVSNGAAVYGRLYAAAHDVLLTSNGKWFGSGVMHSLTLHGGTGGPSGFFIDEEGLGLSIPDPDDFAIHGMWAAQ